MLLVSLAHLAFAEPKLNDYGFVLKPPSTGYFAGGVNAPAVEYDAKSKLYVMYFESLQSTHPSDCIDTYAIGRATSTNGKAWTLDTTPVLQADTGTPGSNRYCSVSQPAVVYDGTTWHLFFSQSKEKIGPGALTNQQSGVGYATSTDGVNFTIAVDQAVPPSSDVKTPVGMPTVAIVAGSFYLLYDQYPDIYIASAPTDLSSDFSVDGMIADNASQTWSTTWLFGPSVLCNQSTAPTGELFVGGDDSSSTRSVGWANSSDWYTWTFDTATPLDTGSMSFAGINHWDVLRNRTGIPTYAMWYSTTDSSTGLKAVGFAASSPKLGKIAGRHCPG